ncbi:hypothetical protein F5B22DRAFT_639321 [Xylaria bambusicola]|uniref:uncharacterized protein n=1 Tax=Xylaria bambusicola TaxID=326684 RepID=UPI0020077418|nr:uncharacterized protein F5B22DRAFT_639321 [Xylaria bambusicola]KAI0506316.1 hypothetical protein F5B22DRAFT_639321 [Xylaria bambusicola]
MPAVRDSIRQIDDQSWLIEGSLLLSRKQAPSSGLASWSDGNGDFFVLTSSSNPPSETQPLSDTSEIQKVYDAREGSAVWRVGEAFIKLKELVTLDATREHTTLQYLRNKQPLDFNIPEVYYYTDPGNRYLIALSKVPGRTLNEIWYELEETKQQECVRRIAKICIDLATWEGQAISGVDAQDEMNFDPAYVLKSCKEIGMDCSSFVFYHADLGPGNILLDEVDGSIEWICTKFRCSSGLDLPQRAGNVATTDWRARVARELNRLGFSDAVDDWATWWGLY